MNKKIEIEKEKILLVEGKHEVGFFHGLLQFMQLKQDFQVIDVGGQDNFRNSIKIWAEDLRNVKSVGVVRDADDDPFAKHQSIRDAFRDNELPYPPNDAIFLKTHKPSVGIYLLPNNSSQGCLETLCLEIVRDDPAIICVEGYITCLNSKSEFRHAVSPLAKAKLQTFLASKRQGDLYIASATKLGLWDYQSPVLNNLKAFIQEM